MKQQGRSPTVRAEHRGRLARTILWWAALILSFTALFAIHHHLGP